MSARMTVAMRTLSTNGTPPMELRTHTRISKTMTTSRSTRTIWLICRCSGVSSRLYSVALAVSLLAKLSRPTFSAS